MTPDFHIPLTPKRQAVAVELQGMLRAAAIGASRDGQAETIAGATELEALPSGHLNDRQVLTGAVNQARVAHLIYDPLIRYRGSIAYDGTLYANDEGAPTYAATPEPRLTERLVERALETGARVTPVEGAAGDGLADASGIAAVLRW